MRSLFSLLRIGNKNPCSCPLKGRETTLAALAAFPCSLPLQGKGNDTQYARETKIFDLVALTEEKMFCKGGENVL